MASTPVTPAFSSRPWFKDPKNPGEVSNNFDYIYSKLRFYGDGLDRHSEKIREDRKTIETITARFDAQEKQNNGYKQLMTNVEKKAEVEIERLRSDLDAEKARRNQLETWVAKLAQSVTEIGHSVTTLRSNVMPAVRTPLENERRRSSQKEAPLPDAAVKLNQRMDDLFNQAVGNKTIVHANFKRIDRVVQEVAQRIESLEGSSCMVSQRIESLERSSNMDSQTITELELHVEHRFETAVLNAQEGLRHKHNAWVEGLKSLQVETAGKIATATNHLASTRNTIQSQVNEHTETFKEAAMALDRINQRVEEVEAAQDPPGTAIKACEAVTARLEPLDARLNALEIAHAALQTATLTPSTTMASASDFDDLRFEVDTMKSRSDIENVASLNFKNRLVALEESRGTLVFARIKERLSALERSRDEINDAQSALANSQAEYVTHEQFNAATNSLASFLNTKIQNSRDELEQALACDVIMLDRRCSHHLESMKTRDENLVQEHLGPNLTRLTDIASSDRPPASQSAYPSPPATSLTQPMSTQNSRSTTTSSAGPAIQTPTTGKMAATQHVELSVPSDATPQPPHEAQPNTQVVDMDSSSKSSSNASSEPHHRVEPNPEIEIIDLRSPTDPSNTVPQTHSIHQPHQQYEPPPRSYQSTPLLPRPSTAIPPPPPPSQPSFFRHERPQAVVTQQRIQQPHQHPLSMAMGAMHQQTDMGMHMEWSIAGHPDVRLVRARQLQQSGGVMGFPREG